MVDYSMFDDAVLLVSAMIDRMQLHQLAFGCFFILLFMSIFQSWGSSRR